MTSSLRSCAQHSSETLGRTFLEKPHAFRNCFERDRDRIIHSTAFRRLDGKTQVFLNGQGDYYRTRLTHTIEVASISRTIARALRLNEDLCEAIALAHDLGHPPFGHAGEKMLQQLMKDHGGFDHNEQSLRVVEFLEEGYLPFSGLNLSYEVLEGLRKHHHRFVTPEGVTYCSPSLEAQLVNIADEIAYYSHDLDDGVEAGLLDPRELENLTLWAQAKEEAIEQSTYFATTGNIEKNRKLILRCLINKQVEELLAYSRKALEGANFHSVMEVRKHPKHLLGFSKSHQKANRELRYFLYEHFYRNPMLTTSNEEACRKIEVLFRYFQENPHRIGLRFLERLEKEGKHRAICDYIAGMTDRYLKSSFASL